MSSNSPAENNINDNNIQQIIKQLAEKGKINPEQIKSLVINTFRQSYCQGKNSKVELDFGFSTNELLIYHKYKIVEKVTDPSYEITNNDPLIKEGKIVKKTFYLPLNINGFSFELTQQIFKKLEKELEKIQAEKKLQNFEKQKDQLICGRISSFVTDGCLVNLGGYFGHWNKKEWYNIYPQIGQSYFFTVQEIKKDTNSNSFKLILTRNSSLFLKQILTLEVPEINKNIIQINHIIRLPHILSKVIVENKEPDVDPIGAIIGPQATRIKRISRHIFPERIEIAMWNENKRKLFFNIISPVKVISLLERWDQWKVVVPAKKASLLLDHEGQLLKEIGNYLNKKIHLEIFEESNNNTMNSGFVVWNGNLTPNEYQNLNNEQER